MAVTPFLRGVGAVRRYIATIDRAEPELKSIWFSLRPLIKTRMNRSHLRQETRWKGNKGKEFDDGYKLYYSGANKQGRNGVGTALSGELKNAVIEVHRKNDCIIRLKICCGGEILNIISAYAPQVGCIEDEKGNFWKDMDGVMQELEEHERVIILERMIDARLREVEISEEHMGFMKGSRTTDGVFCLRQLMEKFREKQRDLHVVFFDLEKAYD
ncbi:uncharacterized protein [Palaemon carinicauda]|uniref:uncharacterized protein n=1 Tax=Palaemon carinicauda TaxID=392227 RepID=UPI0035B6218A